MRGQGYDNGANMSGRHNGVQRRIQHLNPRALFVPCNAHSLNLVLNYAASCCVAVVSFLALFKPFMCFSLRPLNVGKFFFNLSLT